MAENTGRELGWDDQIENDGPEYEVLPAGDYDFDVVNFERARHSGSNKLPPCNKAIVHIKITAPDGRTNTIRHNLFLHTITEGMICSFFTAIGQRKKGERIIPNWSAVIGGHGRCKVGVKVYEGKEYNEIKQFYESEGTAFQPGRF